MRPRPIFHGDLLRYQLDEYHWTQKDLAEIIGRPMQVVSEIINDKKEITRVTAMELAAATGTTPEYWLQAQDAWRLWQMGRDRALQQKLKDITARASASLRPGRKL